MNPAPQAGDQSSLVACVITHHPGPELARHLAALRAQAATVVVIDNASADQDRVARLAQEAGCRFIGNPGNLGIAAALNQAVSLARSCGARWLACFDQDSQIEPGTLSGLLALERAHPRGHAIGILAAAHRDRASGRDYVRRSDVLEQSATWRCLRSTITSGSLLRMDMLEGVGGFDEALFIDAVDHDLCLRARRAGWLVIESPAHVLAHSMGQIATRRVPVLGLSATRHAPSRRYYMVRNQLEVSRRNLWHDPVWSLTGLAVLAAAAIAVVCLEDRKAAKLSAMALGVLDFARRRFGPLR